MSTSPEGINWQETPKNPGLSILAKGVLWIESDSVNASVPFGTHNPTVTHDFILYSSTFQPVLSGNNWSETGLGHHGFHMSLVGGIISAKTNSHDLLARSSTCYRCRLEEANNTGSLAKIKQNMLNISVKHIHTNSQKTAIHVLVCWFFQSSWSSFMSPFTLEHSMIAGYISKTTTMHSIKQVFSNQIVDFSCLQSPENQHIFMQLSCHSQSQTGKSKRSTCHLWWFGERIEEWHCHPLAHHLGSCPGCCTWDCRNLRTIPAHGRLPHRIRSQSLGCRSEWGWSPRPPAKCNINGRVRCRKLPKINVNIREILFKSQNEKGFQWIWTQTA